MLTVDGFLTDQAMFVPKENNPLSKFFKNFSQVPGFGDESKNDRFQLADRRPYERR
jgi:hypothetical protein